MSLIALVIGLAICFNGYCWFLILPPILGFAAQFFSTQTYVLEAPENRI
jgi:hypothetical protein